MRGSASRYWSRTRGADAALDLAHDHGEFVEAVILQQRDRPPVTAQAIGQRHARIGIIEIGRAALRIARQAEDVEGKAAAAATREDIDGIADVTLPRHKR